MVAVSANPTTLGFDQGQDVRSRETDRGCIWVWRLSPRTYASYVRGHLDGDMARLIIDAGEPLYKNGSVSGFHDWFAMTSYDSKSRVDLTNWVMRHRAETRLFIGMRSKIVAMGVTSPTSRSGTSSRRSRAARASTRRSRRTCESSAHGDSAA